MSHERLAVLPQYLLPKGALTRLAGRVASVPRGTTTTRLIRWFVRRYAVDMSEAAEPDIAAYASFNDFFTRALKPGARPLAKADLVCPVDGAISQFGRIRGSQIFQAKGHDYRTRALVGGDEQLAARFDNGHFATLYLAPKDYHRVHMPAAGRLTRMLHVPGELFSVNPTTARGTPFAVILVGATIVGSMATVWHGVVNPPRVGHLREWRYEDSDVRLAQGAEMGRFLLGSTVVLLFPRGELRFAAGWTPGGAIRLGEAMAQFGNG